MGSKSDVTNGSETENYQPSKDEAVDSSPFQEGEKVIAFHGPCLYDAKVQKAELHLGRWRYYIHYTGWNKSWDEWLEGDRLLKHTEENSQKQKELNQKHGIEHTAKSGRGTHAKPKSSSGPRCKKQKLDSDRKEGDIPSEKIVHVQIPSSLKKKLVDDYECVTQLGQLVKLPRSPNVYDILKEYFDYRVRKDGMIGDTIGEILNGLRVYFDKALPAILLYKSERQQYNEVVAENVPPSNVYGAEHLLRLFVKLPEMLSCMNLEMETGIELQQNLVDFLRFIQSNQSSFFVSN